jgi:hypothetical protein
MLLLFSQFYASHWSSTFATITEIGVAYVQTALFIVLLMTVPVILSIIFSKFNPEIQLVSPLNMQLITLGWLLYHLYTQNILQFGTILLAGISTIAIGFVQDIAATSLVGQKADKNGMVTTSLIVETDLSKLQSLLLTKMFRVNLGLRKGSKEIEEGIILRSPSDSQYQTVIMLTKGDEEKKTFLDMVVFEKDKYALKLTDELKEFAKERQEKYLKTILRRQSIKYKSLQKTHAEKLCDVVVEMLKGKAMRVQNVPATSLIKIIGVLGSLSLCVFGYYEKLLGLDTFLAILIPTVVYAIFEFFPVKRGEGKQG